MIQNSIVIEQRYEKFLKEVAQKEIVWTLKSEEGFVTSTSVLYENDNGEEVKLYCFWSNDKLARVCRNKFFNECNLFEISLSAFLENWCIGLYNDDLMVGTNFDWNLFGKEVEPIDLALEIIDILKKNSKKLDLKYFKNLGNLESKIQLL